MTAAASTEFAYDAFISYSWRADYQVARTAESFLEGFRARWRLAPERVRELRLCRDGSDFRLPVRRAGIEESKVSDPVWAIIEAELKKSRYLLVFCSPGAAASAWVRREVEWFVLNRGAAYVLVAVTEGDPQGAPEAVFPRPVLDEGLQSARLWYDLRRLRDPSVPVQRDAEDELVRLAGDLLDWRDGSLAALWERELLRQRRRRLTVAIGMAAFVAVLAVVAVWQAWLSSVESKRARANAIVVAADAADPLTGALLLQELDADPGDGMRVARKLAAQRIPSAVFRGHTRTIRHVAVMPGAARVVTGSDDGTVRVWNRDGHGSPLVLQAGADVTALAVDATRIAAGTEDGAVSVWDGRGRRIGGMRLGASVERLRMSGPLIAAVDANGAALFGDGRAAWSVAASPSPVRGLHLFDARRGLLAFQNGAVEGFELRPGAMTRRPRLPPDEASFGTSEFRPDGLGVATFFEKRFVIRALDGGARYAFEHPSLVTSVHFSPDGTRLVTACSDGLLRVFPSAGGAPHVLDAGVRFITAMLEPLRPDLDAPPATEALFSPDGKRIASLADDGAIRVWSLSNDPPVELTNAFGAECIAFDPASSALAAGTDQGTASLFPLAAPIEPMALPQFPNLHAAAADDTVSMVAAITRDGVAHVWEGGAGAWRALPAAGARGCAFRPRSRELATVHEDGGVRIWSGQGPPTRIDTGTPLENVLYAPGGEALYAWAEKRWVFRIGGGTHRFDGPDSKIWSVSLSGDGRRLLVTYDNGMAVVHETEGRRRSAILRGHRQSVLAGALDRDGSRAVTASQDGTARVWRIGERDLDGRRGESERRVAVLDDFPPGEMLDNAAMSPDGRTFAVVTSEGRALLFPAGGGAPRTLRMYGDLAHIGVIYLLRFSADGTRLLTSGGMDGTSRLWDLEGDTRPAQLAGHAGAIIGHAIARDGRRVMTASENGRILIFTARFEDLVAAIAARTTATLTPDQRITLLGEPPEEARERYERAEKRQRRTPLPESWSFDYPTW